MRIDWVFSKIMRADKGLLCVDSPQAYNALQISQWKGEVLSKRVAVWKQRRIFGAIWASVKKRRQQEMTFAAAFIVLTTFVVKDALRERFEEILVDAVTAARHSFVDGKRVAEMEKNINDLKGLVTEQLQKGSGASSDEDDAPDFLTDADELLVTETIELH